jgi:hypothetical protein
LSKKQKLEDTDMQENFELVQRGFRILVGSMSGFIGQEISRVYRNNWWNEVLSTLYDQRDLPVNGAYAELVDSLDVANCIDQLLILGSREGGPKDAHHITLGDDMMITMSGWCILDGGVAKYVWTADGGLTWNDCGNQDDLTEMDESVIEVAKSLSSTEGYTDAKSSLKNSSFQTAGGLTIDLSAYAGKTVDVIFAAVPEAEPDSFCPLYRFADVEFPIQE